MEDAHAEPAGRRHWRHRPGVARVPRRPHARDGDIWQGEAGAAAGRRADGCHQVPQPEPDRVRGAGGAAGARDPAPQAAQPPERHPASRGAAHALRDPDGDGVRARRRPARGAQHAAALPRGAGARHLRADLLRRLLLPLARRRAPRPQAGEHPSRAGRRRLSDPRRRLWALNHHAGGAAALHLVRLSALRRARDPQLRRHRALRRPRGGRLVPRRHPARAALLPAPLRGGLDHAAVQEDPAGPPLAAPARVGAGDAAARRDARGVARAEVDARAGGALRVALARRRGAKVVAARRRRRRRGRRRRRRQLVGPHLPVAARHGLARARAVCRDRGAARIHFRLFAAHARLGERGRGARPRLRLLPWQPRAVPDHRAARAQRSRFVPRAERQQGQQQWKRSLTGRGAGRAPLLAPLRLASHYTSD
mmetsp:Transcript_7250/g.23200  ORF Transcript_7250/g.23200 Transcript_7250/m.23200 type:complete len:423 (-) Transcript_7250:319-1587(-)